MRKLTDLIVLHCSATAADQDVQAKDIDRWHRQKGWLKIGYHFVITRGGTLQKGRDLDAAGAHVAGFNHRSVGICMVGGVDKDGCPENNFTELQWEVLKLILLDLKDFYPAAKIVGHYQLDNKKACPSFDVPMFLFEWDQERGLPATLRS